MAPTRTTKRPTAEANGNGRARILHVKAKNFKQIRLVDIDLDGNLHAIKGDTDQGKTSFLQAIMAALKGLEKHEKGLVRHGADSAELELVLDVAHIKRVISADPKTKDVLFGKTADGAAIEEVQDFLNTLCSQSAFNPVKWVQLGSEGGKGHTERLRMQRAQLLEAIHMTLTDEDVVEAVEVLGEDYAQALAEVNMDGVNFDQHPFTVCTRLREACSEFYKLQNARAKDAENVLKNTPAPTVAAPKDELAAVEQRAQAASQAFYDARARTQGQANLAQRVTDLRAKVESEAAALPDRKKLESTAAEYYAREEAIGSEIQQLQQELARIQAAIAEKKTALEEVQEKVKKCEELDRNWSDQDARVADLEKLEEELAQGGAPVNLEALRQAMEKAQGLVEAKRLQDRHDHAAIAAADAKRRADNIYRLVELFRDELPKQLLTQADLPVEGLSFDDETVLVDGIPLHQLGTSKQYRIGILIAAALNPHSAFVLVDQAESMGRKDLAEVAQVARERGLQIIASFVAPDAEPGEGVTVMEGGLVKTA
jgi:DNA repair ATPase RecN